MGSVVHGGLVFVWVRAEVPQWVKADRGYSPPGLGDPDGSIPARIAPISELSELFSASDYAVLTLPSTPSTERIIDGISSPLQPMSRKAAQPSAPIRIRLSRTRLGTRGC